MTNTYSAPAAGYQLIGCDRGRKVIKSNMPGEELTICDPDLAETEAAVGRPVTIVDPLRGFLLAAVQKDSTPSEPRAHSMILYLKPVGRFTVQQGAEIAEKAIGLLESVDDDPALALIDEDTILDLVSELQIPVFENPAVLPEVYEDYDNGFEKVFEEVEINDTSEARPADALAKRHQLSPENLYSMSPSNLHVPFLVNGQPTGSVKRRPAKPTNRAAVLNPSQVSPKIPPRKTSSADCGTRRRRSDEEIMRDKIGTLLAPYTLVRRPEAVYPMVREILRFYMSIYNRKGVVSADRMMELFREAVRDRLRPLCAAKRRGPLMPVYLFLIGMYTPGDYFHILETEYMPPPFWFDDAVCERELLRLFPRMSRAACDRLLCKVADFNDRFLAYNDQEGGKHG